MTLDELLAPKQDKFDIALPPAIDLANDETTVDYEDTISDARRGLFFNLLRPEKPRTKYALDRLYTRIERDIGYIPADEPARGPGDIKIRDVFQQYTSDGVSTGEAGDTVSPGGTGLDKLFERTDRQPAIPITRETYGPLQRDVRMSFDRLSRFGWDSPVTDPYGNLMRTELRKLVRTS